MRLLSSSDIRQSIDLDAAIAAVEQALRLEAEGAAALPSRMNIGLTRGWLRVMPGALFGAEAWGVFGGKVMNLNPKTGVRYINLLFAVETGELLAIADAAFLTQLRTAAMSAIFARYAAPAEPEVVGLLGSGFEARGQLEAVVHTVRPKLVRVFSPNAEHRTAFAEQASRDLGLDVRPAASAREAMADAPLVVAATKSPRPTLEGEGLADGCAIISVGSVRPDQREMDEIAMRRTRLWVTDHVEQVAHESGDVIDGLANGWTGRDRFVALSKVVAGEVDVRRGGAGLVAFKTTGTALQDLAVTKAVYERCVASGLGLDLGDWQEVKAPR